MSIQLKPKSIDNDPSEVDLVITSSNKKNRVERIKNDLDNHFTEENTQKHAAQISMPYINLYGFPIDTDHLVMMNEEEVKGTKMGIFSLEGNTLLLATPEPNTKGQKEAIQKLEDKSYNTKLFLCSDISFAKLTKTFNYIFEAKQVDDSINLDTQEEGEEKIDLSQLKEIIKTVSTSQIIETILRAALQNKASDIHFEPEKTSYNMRLRLDGVLYTFANLPKENQDKIESRIKLVSGLKLNVDNIPQDGRFSFKYEQKDIDVRVSMLPSNYGYSIVMRLLGTGNVDLKLDSLGFAPYSVERVESAITQPQGMILNTGPTGSGKTTTLYAFLNQLNDSRSKIITLEDPIEYKLPGISQTQIDKQGGYTFASGLKSILRQDPDIVMVGEIRDSETAEIAVEASLTGHLVLSTLHTNDAAGAITRLMEMQIKGFMLADSLSAVIGQRLVRKLCPHCKRVDTINEKDQQKIVETLQGISPQAPVTVPHDLTFYTSDGCDECNGLGYQGRLGVYEVLTITDGLRELISNRYPSIVEVRNVAMKEGMVTMLQDGILKALQGLTDIKELFENVSTS